MMIESDPNARAKLVWMCEWAQRFGELHSESLIFANFSFITGQ